MGSDNIGPMFDELPLWSAPFGLRLLETIRYSAGVTALDIGPGYGFPLVEPAMRLGRRSRVVGIDPWAEGVAKIAEKICSCGFKNAAVARGDACNLPFSQKTFDLITSNNGINNIGNVQVAVVEIGRVAKSHAQFVFTFNTDRTFIRLYEAFREVLYEIGLPEYNKAVSDDIFNKRKPVSLMERLVVNSGFDVNSIIEDKFSYIFTDATAMLHHFFFRTAFL